MDHTVKLQPRILDIAAAQANAAGIPVRNWIELAITTTASTTLTAGFDDSGFDSPPILRPIGAG